MKPSHVGLVLFEQGFHFLQDLPQSIFLRNKTKKHHQRHIKNIITESLSRGGLTLKAGNCPSLIRWSSRIRSIHFSQNIPKT